MLEVLPLGANLCSSRKRLAHEVESASRGACGVQGQGHERVSDAPAWAKLVESLDRPEHITALFQTEMVIEVHGGTLDSRDVNAAARLAINPGKPDSRSDQELALGRSWKEAVRSPGYGVVP